MSQDYIFNFSHGFERSSPQDQIRSDNKVRMQGFEPPPPLALEEVDEGPPSLPYESGAGMLSEMFNFPAGVSTTNSASELLMNQINYHQQNRGNNHRPDWYGDTSAQAQAMQLFISNPPHESPESPSHHHHHHQQQQQHQHQHQQELHMLLPNTVPSTSSTLHHQPSFGSTTSTGQGHFGPSTQFSWVNPPGGTSHEGESVGGGVEGLSLSLSSSLQHLEATKVEDMRIGDDSGAGGMLYFNQVGSGGGDPYRNMHMQGASGVIGQIPTHPTIHMGFGSSSLGGIKVLRNSRYVKPAQELLEEFCSVGRGNFKKNKSVSKHNNPTDVGGAGGESSSSKDLHPLSSAERIEHQRRKVKLSTMLDEVDRRYNHYCEQMQMVVNSFDLVMGFGAAVPYTALAQKAMSRHFRCLKDAIASQLKNSCELLGEKDAGSSGVTKGETPRLKLLEQSLRQQRAFHQMGMMEQEAWRPQRGLPERSVNILRAWLFEHFLHPYPSDADKHLLARQTGLSRNQVSNWFINARVRLWKPMVEEMYQQEGKEEFGDQLQDEDQDIIDQQENTKSDTNINYNNNNQQHRTNGPSSSSSSSALAQTSMPPPPPPPQPPATTPTSAKRTEINDSEYDALNHAINMQKGLAENQVTPMSYPGNISIVPPSFQADANMGSTPISFGTNAGDVSLTLGLRHAGNLPEKDSFSVRDFGGC
nr:BEL1-like homeodomain protein 4 [Tanacetum cinerariifolium]